MYRRALARAELGKDEAALQDVEAVLKELPDPNSNKEAVQLKEKLIARLSKAAPPKHGLANGDEMFPDISIERTEDGITSAKNEGNRLFASGAINESTRWFSKCIWLIESGYVKGVCKTLQSVLHSNRAFAHIKQEKWIDAERDCISSLSLNVDNSKALYRRAWARYELGKDEAALQDIDGVLAKVKGDPRSSREATELQEKILKRRQAAKPMTTTTKGGLEAEIGGWQRLEVTEVSEDSEDEGGGLKIQQSGKESSIGHRSRKAPVLEERGGGLAAPPPQASFPSSPPSSASSPKTGVNQAGRTQREVRTAAAMSVHAPNIPAAAPKNSFELLRHFGSMRRHPEVLARYVRERVNPGTVYSLFSKNPIEADDLATLLAALKANLRDEPDTCGPAVVADYLRQLLRTRSADTQFKMLSTSEREMLSEMLAQLPASEEKLRVSFRKII
jgi:tetratricopeptide (TPR) repeat protein